MKMLATVADFSAALDAERCAGRTVGLVPTMGALHDGHGSLVERAAAECDVVAVTVFVNPLQFGAGEDLDAYPRTLDADVKLAEQAGATLVFAPTVAEMYRDGTATTVSVASGMTAVLEGASRPGHFDGVATVVAKLFAMTGRSRAYFGEKDFQQLAVVRRMARDLSFPVEVVGCPTVRADDGLALSSRNAYLSDEERAAAPVLHRALRAGAEVVLAGGRDAAAVRAAMEAVLATESLVDPDYAVVVDAATLATPAPLDGDLRLLVAARLPSARLIDNLGVTVADGMHRKDD
ncbi:MAG: pantoate-beta-alanine ligase [Acidimicrobiales bacterium]|jgi:pantoate--beta-alanine ligase|nr:pantoate-beta-alanine ligase [Acidimicrobiales bacterium]